MLTVHPSIMIGSFVWDEERLPRDEFDMRMETLRAAMKQNGWRAIAVYGDAREHEALAWFSNFIPRMRWAMALFPAEGEPLLLSSVSSRDIPAMRTMTWIKDVKSGWEWQWFEQWVKGIEGEGEIGTIALDYMTPLLFEGVAKRLGARLRLVEADAVFAEAHKRQRPREIATIRESAAILRNAADAIAQSLDAGDDAVSAALAGERAARNLAAHDVRTLISVNGGATFHANMPRSEQRPSESLVYLAVKYLGHWSDAYIERGAAEAVSQRVRATLESLIERLRPGASLNELAEGARAQLAPLSIHPAVSGRFGHRIGLSPSEGSEIRPGASGAVEPNTIYSLYAGGVDSAGRGSIASALVATRASGACDIIHRSWASRVP